jgi:acetyl-CoA carboxylase carboxyltransferase component
MGLEGAVNIIHAKALEAEPDAAARAALHARLTQELKDEHTAIVTASHFGYDDVIDPADTREILLRTLETLPPVPRRSERKRLIEPF